LVLQASGGKGNLQSFSKVAEEVLDRTLWGVRFYMLADRDAVPILGPEAFAKRNFKVLGRYHLENYFLDAEVLAACFRNMEADDSWLRSATEIENVLREIARAQVGYATALIEAKRVRDAVGNVSLMPAGAHGMNADSLANAIASLAQAELGRIKEPLHSETIVQSCRSTYTRLNELLRDHSALWKQEFPGKPILGVFAGRARITEGRLKTLYLAAAETADLNPFSEIIDIFRGFAFDGEAEEVRSASAA
jgi:hypothetical protein